MATLLKTAPQRIDVTPRPMPRLSDRPIDGSRYWSRDFMQAEWEGIWTKAWLIGGLASQVAKPGDFFTYEIGRESILVTHGEDGQIRAFYNLCRHRGNKLVWNDYPGEEVSGSCRQFVCKYHAWRYNLQGDLTFVQQEQEFFDLDKSRYGLVSVHCEVWEGFIFVNFASHTEAPEQSLRDFLGPMITDLAEGGSLGTAVAGRGHLTVGEVVTVLTPLARERARALGVTIHKERT